MLMGRQAEQFFGSSCQDLVNKRSYPTEKTLPEEIAKTIGRNKPFQIKVNLDGELIVKGILPKWTTFWTTNTRRELQLQTILLREKEPSKQAEENYSSLNQTKKPRVRGKPDMEHHHHHRHHL